jgi:hypothetical protein
MPGEGRPFWWPRCATCARWLSAERIELLDALTDPLRCARCARLTDPRSEETAYA